MRTVHHFLLVLTGAASFFCFSVGGADTNSSQPPAKPGKSEKKAFFFEGGNPLQFILAMDKHFRTRLGQILSIPSSLARAEVPKMRIVTDKPEEALQVYNHLEDPLLGQWRYAGPPDDPAVLALVPDKQIAINKANTGIKVKALPLASIHKNKWDRLQEDISLARDFGAKTAERLGGDQYDGHTAIQAESKILIVSGSPAYIEMVESVLSAYRVNGQAEDALMKSSIPPAAK
jgi:hypothetical protein